MSVSGATVAPVEEGKLLSESLSTVKIQVSQMKRHLVRVLPLNTTLDVSYRCICVLGTGPAHGRAQERESDVG